MKEAGNIILCHHEKFDGTGLPRRPARGGDPARSPGLRPGRRPGRHHLAPPLPPGTGFCRRPGRDPEPRGDAVRSPRSSRRSAGSPSRGGRGSATRRRGSFPRSSITTSWRPGSRRRPSAAALRAATTLGIPARSGTTSTSSQPLRTSPGPLCPVRPRSRERDGRRASGSAGLRGRACPMNSGPGSPPTRARRGSWSRTSAGSPAHSAPADIRGVGDDDVEPGPGPPEGRKEVAPDEPDAGATVGRGVRRGDPEGPGGDIGGRDPGSRESRGPGRPRCCRSRSPGPGWSASPPDGEGDDRFDEELRFGARDEDSRAHPERQRPEFLPTGQVGQRGSRRAPPDQLEVPIGGPGGKLELGMGVEGFLGKPGRVEEEDPGVDVGAGSALQETGPEEEELAERLRPRGRRGGHRPSLPRRGPGIANGGSGPRSRRPGRRPGSLPSGGSSR